MQGRPSFFSHRLAVWECVPVRYSTMLFNLQCNKIVMHTVNAHPNELSISLKHKLLFNFFLDSIRLYSNLFVMVKTCTT